MRRREFITLVVSATAALPQVVDAQQAERVRRIGVLMAIAGDDPEAPLRTAAFTQGLQELGWTDGRNMRIDYRWAGGNAEKARQYAVELIPLDPDVFFALGNHSVTPLLQATRTVPIVFAGVADPVGAGFWCNRACSYFHNAPR